MPLSPDAPAAQPPEDTSGLARIFVLIVLVEIVTIAGLYWFGRHFA